VGCAAGEWTKDAAAATHVLFSSPESPRQSPAPGGEAPSEYFRTLARMQLSSGASLALIHVWYRPDSYDAWLPAQDFSSPEPEPTPKGSAWVVGSKWLTEALRYNELMNEEDYEKEETDAAQSETASAADAAEKTEGSAARTSRKRGLPEEVTVPSGEDDPEAPAGGGGKRIKLFVAARPSGAVAVDLSGSNGPPPGKNYEVHPVAGGAIGNLPPEAEPSRTDDEPAPVRVVGQAAPAPTSGDGDVSMADAGASARPADAGAAAESGVATPAIDVTASAEGDAALRNHQRQVAENLARKYLAEQTQEVIIPSYSTWFAFSGINAIEKRSLPEFFNGKNRSKTPTIYRDYRDFMINTYRLNPSEYLTFTACRRNLAGDVCAIMRVHAFLEQWGLINYQVDPESRPATLGPPFTGHFRITVDTPRGLQPLHPGTRPYQQPSGAALSGVPRGEGSHAGTSAAGAGAPDLVTELRRNVYQSTMKSSTPVDGPAASSLAAAADAAVRAGAGAAPSYSCDTCGTDCTRTRYHSVHAPSRGPGAGGYVLCSSCYLEGRFPSSMYSGDFVRVDDTAFKQGGAPSEDDWSDAEMLRLLEGLEMFDDDWAQVANHVGTRSREQCITRFLQMPIEDPYLDGGAPRTNGSVPAAAEGSNGAANGDVKQSDLGPLQYVRDLKNAAIPFAQTDNPVMSVVAFLASAVSPAVAAAAAQSALGELTEGMRRRIARKDAAEKAKEAESPSKAKDGDASAATDAEATAADAMDVDKAKEPETPTEGASAAEPSTSEAPANGKPATPRDPETVPRNAVEKAAAVALGAAAAKAHVLATFEERECQRLVSQVIEAQMRKMEIKMAQFEELESLLEAERRSVEAGRKQVSRLRVRPPVPPADSRPAALRRPPRRAAATRCRQRAAAQGHADAPRRHGARPAGQLERRARRAAARAHHPRPRGRAGAAGWHVRADLRGRPCRRLSLPCHECPALEI
jgi:SWI/SNF related-matrix-associated actin-dependent regulator of chromatin subfamily C